jgi:aspartate aminotransferase
VRAAVPNNPILAARARAAPLQAEGVDVVSLAAGEPDTSTPRAITEAAAAAALHGDHHHGPAAGDPALRTAIADRLPTVSPAFTAEDIQATLGTKHALFLGLQAVLAHGRRGPAGRCEPAADGWGFKGHGQRSSGSGSQRPDASPLVVGSRSFGGLKMRPGWWPRGGAHVRLRRSADVQSPC